MLDIIIPSYNEPRVNETARICNELFPEALVIVVRDWSGQGKGHSIDRGLKQVRGHDIICFIDGDMDIHPRMIKRLLPFMEDYDIAVGAKAIGNLTFRRKLITILSRIYIKIMFNTDVDSQTGIKVFKASAIPEWKDKGFMFDIEILCKAKRRGARIIEVPIEAVISKEKGLKVLWLALIGSIKIWFRL